MNVRPHSVRGELKPLFVDAIEVEASRRPVDRATVNRLMESMGDPAVGLRTPLSVRFVEGRPSHDGCDDSYVLVTGVHRLEAAKQLGWEKIDCFVVECSDIEAEMWEITENLHRADLTKEQRDRQLRRLAELIREREAIVPQSAEQLERRGKGRPVSVVTQVAKQTGLSDDTVRRALAPQSPAPKPVKLAPEPRNDLEAKEAQLAALMSAWNRAGREAREEFLSRIDVPARELLQAWTGDVR